MQAEVRSVLRTMYPEHVDMIPEPIAFHFHRWKQDLLFRGSFSSWSASFRNEHHINVRANVNERLWFAGEATSKYYVGEYRESPSFLQVTLIPQGICMGHTSKADIAMPVPDCAKGGGCSGLKHIDKCQQRET